MLYDAYEVQRSFLAGASKLAGFGAGWLNNPANPWGYSSMGPLVSASLEVFAHATAPHGKPEFGIETVRVRGKRVAVREEILLRKPFGQLKHFVREGVESGPSLLIVALSLALLPLQSQMAGLLLVLGLFSAGSGINRPPVFGLISLNSPPHEQGANLGVAQSFGALARILGPIFAGSLFFVHEALPYLISGGIAIGNAPIAPGCVRTFSVAAARLQLDVAFAAPPDPTP